MPDDSFLGRVRDRIASLGPGQDGDPSPQARDEDPIAISREEFTEEPDRDDIETWRTEYYHNPLIRQPIRNFAADVVEPGVSVEVDAGAEGTDVPTTDSAHPNPALRDEPLDEALEAWLASAVINSDSFDGDTAELLEDVVLDLRGRRGSALVEHVYDDARERQRLMGLRAFRVETTTAYTREGKAVLLRGDDEPGSFDTVAIRPTADYNENAAPTTPAGQTAAFVQFDDLFGSYDEKDDIPFALGDVTFLTHDADTGAVFGRPDTASVAGLAANLREEFDDLQQALKSTAYGHWLLQVDTDDIDEARELANGVQPDQPESLNVVNYGVESVEEVFGDYPSGITDSLQQQIEFILAAMPTPLYRVGFAGDINRDITSEQREDYRDEVKRERDRLEAAFDRVVHMKARELLAPEAGPHADTELPVDVHLRIRPEESESPLADEEFDPEAFSQLASGVKALAPGGAVGQVVTPEEVRETLLGLDGDLPGRGGETPMDEADDAVREAFGTMTDAELGTRYEEGDEVSTPQGVGVVADVLTETVDTEDETIEASSESPTYVVVVEDGRAGFGTYAASEIHSTSIETDVDPIEAAGEDGEEAEAAILATLAPGDGEFDVPPSWRKSSTANRVIALKAFASMGGSFDGCVREMRGNVSRPNAFCGSFLDYVVGNEFWRGDSILPGD